MANKQNLYFDQGTSFSQSFTIQHANGVPVDLSTYTGRSHLRKEYTSPTFYEFTVTLGGNTGVVSISLSPTQSSNIAAGRYLYDVEIENNGNVSRIIEGFCSITPEVTR